MKTLESLEKEIRAKFKKPEKPVWLFPRIKGIKGFYGKGYCQRYGKSIMFVAPRPSSGTMQPEHDPRLMLFYKALKKFGLENAHVTDFIKTRAKAGEWGYEDLRDNLEIFENEFGIVNPDVAIAIGRQGFDWLSFWLIMKKPSLKSDLLMHYSQRRPVESYRSEFENGLQEILNKRIKKSPATRRRNRTV